MAEAIFIYEGSKTIIQCGIDDKMEDIIKAYKKPGEEIKQMSLF